MSRYARILLTVVSLLLARAASAAQDPAAPAPGATPTPESGGWALATVVLVVALFLLVGVLAKLIELRRRRAGDAALLQSHISDALLREPQLAVLTVTASADVPAWRGTPATVDVAGQVPSEEARDAVLRLVRAEAARLRPDVRVVDRLAVVPAMARQAA